MQELANCTVLFHAKEIVVFYGINKILWIWQPTFCHFPQPLYAKIQYQIAVFVIDHNWVYYKLGMSR
jgi:hypothetical protein